MRIFSAQIAPCSVSLADAIRCRPDVGKETFANDAFDGRGMKAPVLMSHIDGFVAGEVVARIAHRGWHYADFILDERYWGSVRVGTPVSIGFLPHRVETDDFSGAVRHTRAKLVELSVLGPGERPFHREAKVTRIMGARKAEATSREPLPKSRLIAPRRPVRRESEMDELDRRIDEAGPNPDIKAILRTLLHDLGYAPGIFGLPERRTA